MIDFESSETPQDGTLLAYAQLVRLPAVFTALADVAMGFLFVQTAWEASDGLVLAALAVASVLLYAAGMVFNDVFDYEFDTGNRPDRPLASGRISRSAACRFGSQLLIAGTAAGWVTAALAGSFWPGVVATALAGCVMGYDGLLKQTPLGPPAMGACRMLNVLLGMSVVGIDSWGPAHGLVAGGIGTYITGVTWFARTEARESRRLHLTLAIGVMMAGIGLLAWFPHWADRLVPLLQREPHRWDTLMTVLGLLIAWRCSRAVVEPVPWRVQMAVRQCILSLVILDAAVCFAVCGVVWAVMILLLLVPVTVLGRWVYVT